MSFLSELKDSYEDLGEIVYRYWTLYGGVNSFITSVYVHFSLVLTFLCYGYWTSEDWFERPISIIPSLIGFTMGAYAVLLAVGDDKFKQILSSTSEDGFNPSLSLHATFVHFMFVQFLALSMAIIASAKPIYNSPMFLQKFFLDLYPGFIHVAKALNLIGSCIGFFAFVYAVTLSIATTFAVFRISRAVAHYYDSLERNSSTKKES